MIYIIISNIGLALITIVMYIRYSHFRISTSLKIRDLDKALKVKKEEKQKLEEKLRAELKTEVEQVKSLLRELEAARKERQEEIKLRLQAEKQIELSMQKIQEVQVRVNDWKAIQDSTLRDSKDAIFKVGDDLFQKLKQSHKNENDESRHFMEENIKSLHGYIGSIEKKIEELRKKNVDVGFDQVMQGGVSSDISSGGEQKSVSTGNKPIGNMVIDEVAKKSLEEVVSLISVSGLKHLQDYILASKLDETKVKFMLCDLVFVREKVAYFIDFKADRYFKEFEKLSEKEKQASLPSFKQKIDKYFSYISNPKYRALIEKLALSLKMNFSEVKIIFAVRNRDDIKLMKDLKYIDKATQLKIEIFDVNGVNDLVL